MSELFVVDISDDDLPSLGLVCRLSLDTADFTIDRDDNETSSMLVITRSSCDGVVAVH